MIRRNRKYKLTWKAGDVVETGNGAVIITGQMPGHYDFDYYAWVPGFGRLFYLQAQIKGPGKDGLLYARVTATLSDDGTRPLRHSYEKEWEYYERICREAFPRKKKRRAKKS